MKRFMYVELYNLLDMQSRADQKIIGNNVKYKYFIKKNKDIILNKILKQESKIELFQKMYEFETRKNECKMINTKEEEEIIKKENGEEEKIKKSKLNEEVYIEEIKKLEEQYKETLDNYKQFNEEEIENIELYKINVNNIPQLSQAELDFLYDNKIIIES